MDYEMYNHRASRRKSLERYVLRPETCTRYTDSPPTVPPTPCHSHNVLSTCVRSTAVIHLYSSPAVDHLYVDLLSSTCVRSTAVVHLCMLTCCCPPVYTQLLLSTCTFTCCDPLVYACLLSSLCTLTCCCPPVCTDDYGDNRMQTRSLSKISSSVARQQYVDTSDEEDYPRFTPMSQQLPYRRRNSRAMSQENLGQAPPVSKCGWSDPNPTLTLNPGLTLSHSCPGR